VLPFQKNPSQRSAGNRFPSPKKFGLIFGSTFPTVARVVFGLWLLSITEMLAERPSTVENSGAEIDLFAGLSFPEVPSAPVEVSSRQSIVGLPNPPAYNPQHIPLASILVDTAVNSELEQNIRKSGNLSALYSPEVKCFFILSQSRPPPSLLI